MISLIYGYPVVLVRGGLETKAGIKGGLKNKRKHFLLSPKHQGFY